MKRFLSIARQALRLWQSSWQTRREVATERSEAERQQMVPTVQRRNLDLEVKQEGDIYVFTLLDGPRAITSAMMVGSDLYPEIVAEMVVRIAEALSVISLSQPHERVCIDCRLPLSFFWKLAEAHLPEYTQKQQLMFHAAYRLLECKRALLVFRPRWWPF